MGDSGDEQSSFLTDDEKEALLNGIQEIQQEQEETKIDTQQPKNTG
jgi:hypothetical protein